MAAPAEVAFGQLLFGGISFMLLAAVTLVAFLVTYQKRLLRQQLELRTAEAAYQRQLLGAIIEAQERERERIGRDLHDGIGATLVTAKLLVNRLAVTSSPAAAADSQPGVLKLLQEIMGTVGQEVRNISHDLYPVVLSRFGLAEAIQHLADGCHETGTLAIDLALDYPRSLPLAQELALYRICQELIHNSIKHAHGATLLTVQLQQRGVHLELVVSDDGCGFVVDPPTAVRSTTSGAGLRSMEVRAQMLQAQLHRTSAPGQGTRTVVELETGGF